MTYFHEMLSFADENKKFTAIRTPWLTDIRNGSRSRRYFDHKYGTIAKQPLNLKRDFYTGEPIQ